MNRSKAFERIRALAREGDRRLAIIAPVELPSDILMLAANAYVDGFHARSPKPPADLTKGLPHEIAALVAGAFAIGHSERPERVDE